MIKNEVYFQISGWMRNRLNLKGNELMVYAIIYGFSQDGESKYQGTRQYLSDLTGLSKDTVSRILRSLCEKDYLKRNEVFINGITLNNYSANLEIAHIEPLISLSTPIAKYPYPLCKTHTPPMQNADTPYAKCRSYNNIHNSLDNDIDNNTLIFEFEEIWRHYPNKKGKKKALDKYIAYRKKGTTYDEVFKGVKAYAEYCKSNHIKEQYIKHGSTFFNNAEWLNEYAGSKEVNKFEHYRGIGTTV